MLFRKQMRYSLFWYIFILIGVVIFFISGCSENTIIPKGDMHGVKKPLSFSQIIDTLIKENNKEYTDIRQGQGGLNDKAERRFGASINLSASPSEIIFTPVNNKWQYRGYITENTDSIKALNAFIIAKGDIKICFSDWVNIDSRNPQSGYPEVKFYRGKNQVQLLFTKNSFINDSNKFAVIMLVESHN